MHTIRKVVIQNFKKFKSLTLDFEPGKSVLIGNNEAGKSSILLALDLALGGSRNRIEALGAETLLNQDSVTTFLAGEKSLEKLPELIVDVFLEEGDDESLYGTNNAHQRQTDGVRMILAVMAEYGEAVQAILADDQPNFPFEYYAVRFETFAGRPYAAFNRPIKHMMLDGSRIDGDHASREYTRAVYAFNAPVEDRYKLENLYRQGKQAFTGQHLAALNADLRAYQFDVRSSVRSNLETDLIITEDNIPLENHGKGRQCFIKTEFALSKHKQGGLDVMLLEEPENHLSHSSMKALVAKLAENESTQLFIATHSSHICSRLDLRHALLIGPNAAAGSLKALSPDTAEFFMKAPDNNVLEFALSKKVILVEGDAEFILVEEFYKQCTNGRLPHVDDVHIISIGGTSFKRYMELANLLGIRVAAIRDNDKNYQKNCIENYVDFASEVLLCPLHGELDLAAQRAAIDPAPAGKRKVVLATNIAETSLTINGVRVVIDAGLARVPRFDPGSGMARLDTQRISKASATQRAGRAGRLEPGVCYRLWSQDQHEQLAAYASAEILSADLAGLALQLGRWGVTPGQLVWLDIPPAAAYAQAQDLLERLGALDGEALTRHGQAMAELPAHPRIAHLLLRGQALGLADMACDVAALLGERDILRGAGADLHSRLVLLSGEERAARGAQGGVQRARQLARQYRGYLRGKASEPVSDPDHPRWLGALLALAYPDRVAQQRRAGGAEYRLANGRAALFAEADSLMKQPWLVIADLGSRQGQREERIYLAVDFDPALFDSVLAEQVRVVDQLDWDEREGVLRAERQRKVGELILSREPLTGLDETARSQALVNLVRRKGLELLPWTPELRQWQARVALLRQLDLGSKEQSEWPDVSDAALLKSLEQWLMPYLGKVSRLSHFANLDLSSIVHNLLPWPLPQRLDELAPHHLSVPSGSSIRLDYSEQPPILAVRLQELFGLAETPRIAGGRQVVKLHLLSPARRPVQVTQDLANFWRSTYAEVKKDLKGRYPKHYWPDDPLVAEATARIKPRKS